MEKVSFELCSFYLKLSIFLVFVYLQQSFLTLAESEEIEESEESYLDPFLNKTYKLDSRGGGCDDFSKALGIGFFSRHIFKIVHPVMKLTQNGDKYTITITSFFKTMVETFTLGEEFNYETIDGRNVKAVVTQDKNVLTEIQRGEITVTNSMEFGDDKVKITSKMDDEICVLIYKPHS